MQSLHDLWYAALIHFISGIIRRGQQGECFLFQCVQLNLAAGKAEQSPQPTE